MFSLDDLGDLIEFSKKKESLIVEKIQVSNSIQSDDSLNEDISDEDKVVWDYMECYRMPHDSMKMYSWYHPINSGEFSIK